MREKELPPAFSAELFVPMRALTVQPGECFGIMGASGCGKYTQLKLMMRFWAPGRGVFPFRVTKEDVGDAQNEPLVLRSLHQNWAGWTNVLVSHRKSSLGICSRVVHMEGGKKYIAKP